MSIAEARKKLAESTKSLEITRNIYSGVLDSAELNRRLSRARSKYKTLKSRQMTGLVIPGVIFFLGVILVIGFATTPSESTSSAEIIGFLLMVSSLIVGYITYGPNTDTEVEKLEIEIGAMEKGLPMAKQFESSKIQSKERASSLLQKGGLANLQEVLKIYSNLGYNVNDVKKEIAQEKEKLLDYAGAITDFEELELHKDAKRVRRKMLDEKKVDQTVVHGDYVDDRDTIIKDSVISKSNVGAGGVDKLAKIKELKELLDSGAIDKDDYEKMKREIIG